MARAVLCLSAWLKVRAGVNVLGREMLHLLQAVHAQSCPNMAPWWQN
jgi:hypothetical protein